MSRLHVETTLPENGTDVGTMLEVRLDLLENADFSLCWRANEDYL